MNYIGRVLDALDEILAPMIRIHLTVNEVNRHYDEQTYIAGVG